MANQLQEQKRTRINRLILAFLVIIGASLVITSIFFNASLLSITGVAIISWGLILLYITSSTYVPITLSNALASSTGSNTERILMERRNHKKVYICRRRISRKLTLSLIFLSISDEVTLPLPGEITEKLWSTRKNGILLTPPGFSLLRFFEKELGVSLVSRDLDFLCKRLPKLMVEDLGIAKKVDMQVQNDTVIVEVTESLLDQVCQQTDSLPRTHSQVGCVLSSSIACALAKVTGKPISIQKEVRDPEAKTSRIEYRIEKY